VLRHYSRTPIYYVPIQKYSQKIDTTPNGFDFYTGAQLEKYVGTQLKPPAISRQEQTDKINEFLGHCYEVKLSFDQICIIDTYLKLITLVEKYGVGQKINWIDVAKDYDGIYYVDIDNIKNEIESQNKDNPKYNWFASLNVSSGYVWNTVAIQELMICC
jgi:hypothetical protein